MKVYIGRDKVAELGSGSFCYAVGMQKLPPIVEDNGDEVFEGKDDATIYICSKYFHMIFPKAVHLKPGEGPVPIEIGVLARRLDKKGGDKPMAKPKKGKKGKKDKGDE